MRDEHESQSGPEPQRSSIRLYAPEELDAGAIDLACITRQHFTEWNPSDINEGWCFVWAWLAYRYAKNHGAKLKTWTSEEEWHAWIEIDGLHFDAEVPRGAKSPEELPFFQRGPYLEEGKIRGRRGVLSEDRFQALWGACESLFGDAKVSPWK